MPLWIFDRIDQHYLSLSFVHRLTQTNYNNFYIIDMWENFALLDPTLHNYNLVVVIGDCANELLSTWHIMYNYRLYPNVHKYICWWSCWDQQIVKCSGCKCKYYEQVDEYINTDRVLRICKWRFKVCLLSGLWDWIFTMVVSKVHRRWYAGWWWRDWVLQLL